MSFPIVYEEYLNNLEEISQEYDELTDTDVRERLHEVINWYFIWGNGVDSNFPQKYAMFSEEGDKKVAAATLTFIQKASIAAKDIPVGKKRNELIENPEVETKNGDNYDLFLGSSDDVLPPEKPSSDALYGDYD